MCSGPCDGTGAREPLGKHHFDRATVQGELGRVGAWGGKGEGGRSSGDNAIDSHHSCLKIQQFFMNKHFSIFCLTLVDFQSPEVDTFDNFAEC